GRVADSLSRGRPPSVAGLCEAGIASLASQRPATEGSLSTAVRHEQLDLVDLNDAERGINALHFYYSAHWLGDKRALRNDFLEYYPVHGPIQVGIGARILTNVFVQVWLDAL